MDSLTAVLPEEIGMEKRFLSGNRADLIYSRASNRISKWVLVVSEQSKYARSDLKEDNATELVNVIRAYPRNTGQRRSRIFMGAMRLFWNWLTRSLTLPKRSSRQQASIVTP